MNEINTDLLGQLIVIIIAITGIIKSFIPEKHKKFVQVIPLLIGIVFSFITEIDWVTLLVGVITSVGTYEIGKGIKKTDTETENYSWDNK